jgi:hypothetical protein
MQDALHIIIIYRVLSTVFFNFLNNCSEVKTASATSTDHAKMYF